MFLCQAVYGKHAGAWEDDADATSEAACISSCISYIHHACAVTWYGIMLLNMGSRLT